MTRFDVALAPQPITSVGDGAIVPIVLCGGSGTRLWPMSRRDFAKQHAPVLGAESPFQETLRRLAANPVFAAPIVITSVAGRFIAAEQAAAVRVGIELVLEPEGRDTLAAATLGALVLAARGGEETLGLLLPSDHLIPDPDAFAAAAAAAAAAASGGDLVTFGLMPRGPATGYGYIRPGATAEKGGFHIGAFVEKPDAARAETLVAEGYLWNAGMFCFKAGAALREIEAHAPGTLRAVRAALDEGGMDLGSLRLGDSYAAIPKTSFDIGVMEKTRRGVVMPADFTWSDVGDWREIWTVSPRDEAGVVTVGDVVARDSRDSYLRSSGRLVCAVGVENLAVIETPDAVLVCPMDRAQEVKALVATLERDGRSEATASARSYRPWGWYQTMDIGPRFRVKRIVVNPGAKLSLQRHHHRAEHWVVVHGTAEVTRDAEVMLVHENQSVYLPLGSVHRLANPGKIPCELIEVQTGSYLEEDDIIRIEDDFGRG
ncbi:mannose-1-phosphate guanylyltransferase/mannose-6-phosphate isomerase [Amaricoccus solimangrovi]|uniref:mannose-1-phosphate guanylyltransferase n=1 Tax=Amaricoccus solimangrovi TaxID=2589815 RepID=A0A501WPH6_9RHOB|nr:mannose-1-phosphate guanylyltransferase/mannose-6-phosphate isomerase [Amaricoccus solimangrovi]TPE48931.1 mannose-1-phosphate guanylyltransferase/mannose-6-phosphate isomerase [Amaricoccus solimangrovi]